MADLDYVKKNVVAVHIGGSLTALQRKMWNVLLLQAYDDLLVKRVHQMNVSLLCGLLDYNSNDRAHLRTALESLVKTPVRFNLMDDKIRKSTENVTGMLSRGTIVTGTSVVEWSYDEVFSEVLYEPEIYARISATAQRPLKGSFAMALWENCTRYRDIPHAEPSTGFKPLETWRDLLGATGTSYDEFRTFNERVIKPAVREVNRVSDIEVEPVFEKKGSGRNKKVARIKFLVKANKQRTLFTATPTPEVEVHRHKEAYLKLRELGLSDRAAVSAVMDDEPLALQIALDTERKFRAGKVNKPAAFAAKLIAIKAQVGPSPIEIERKKDSAGLKIKAALSDSHRKLRVEFESQRRQQVLGALSPSRRAELLASFVESQGGAPRGYDPVTRSITNGITAGVFEAYCVSQTLGDYSPEMLEKWISERFKAKKPGSEPD